MTFRILAVASMTLVCGVATAEELSGAAIARKTVEVGASNLAGLKAEVAMTTTDKSGAARQRKLTMASKRIDGRMHTLVRFRAPSEVAGIALLAVEGRPGKPDDVVVYLPAYKRTRKISPGQRGASFADTDFSYADFSRGAQPVDVESTKRLADERLLDRPVYVLEGPAPADAPFARVKVWVDQQTFLAIKAESYDKDGALVRTYTV
ncbi:MAG: outer membrane lipoprotein-sorting protein, partial [Myxococcales bacterium]